MSWHSHVMKECAHIAMSTIHGVSALGRPPQRIGYLSPLETYWNAFQEWRKHERLGTQLHRLTERELTDIGITRGEIDYLTSYGSPPFHLANR